MPSSVLRSAIRAASLLLALGLAAPQAAQARSHRVRHMLVVTFTGGFHHDSIPTARETLQKLGEESKLWDTEFADSADEVKRTLTRDHLKGIDVVFFAETTGELPMTDDDKAALLEWIRAGHGFVGAHSATDTFYQWPEYGRLIGGYFNGHPWHQAVKLKVEDPGFPGASAFIGSPEVKDEIYQFRNWSRDDLHVILSIDNGSIDVSKGARADHDYASTWARMEGKGRVFYTSLGHEQDVWKDPRYQSLLLGGVRWALGLARARVTPDRPMAKAAAGDAGAAPSR